MGEVAPLIMVLTVSGIVAGIFLKRIIEYLNELDAMYVTGQQEQQDMRVYVLESDITNAQNNQKVRVTESTF